MPDKRNQDWQSAVSFQPNDRSHLRRALQIGHSKDIGGGARGGLDLAIPSLNILGSLRIFGRQKEILSSAVFDEFAE